jgi:hypothetical protein
MLFTTKSLGNHIIKISTSIDSLLHINIHTRDNIEADHFLVKMLLSDWLNVIAQLLLYFVSPVGVFNRYSFHF